MRILLFVFLVLELDLSRAADTHGNCEALLTQAVGTLPEITLEQFDRTEGKGWRVLETAKCYPEAEVLLTQYLATHEPQSSLFLHLGQMQLRQEKRGAAAASLQKSLRPSEQPNSPFKFNAFVSALIAFTEQDRPRFDVHFAVVHAGSDNFGNRQNMRLLSALSENFNAKYLDILAVLEKNPLKK